MTHNIPVLSAIMIGMLCYQVAGAANDLDTDTLDVSDFAEWQQRSFSGNTDYTVMTDEDRADVVTAETEGQASAFYRQGRIDLEATPCLTWRWRVGATAPASLDERSKAGDDFAARVYVVKRGGLAFWRTKTINYVWSASQPVGQRWPNAYAGDNALMWSLNSGNQQAGSWVTHSRDIQQDWQRAFSESIDHLDGIAIMTDGDDSNSTLSAAYADLQFSARQNDGSCTGRG
ncbi:MAG: hypothetical protein CMQ34_05280 [Gammaproteobacteria bacterium]|nr:hypothetical protein [Gammaproteobacteria bacterium]|tara:strand:- start:608 stop:1300 length:693 start_codon:yes stop_codon:yes gene_type:complete